MRLSALAKTPISPRDLWMFVLVWGLPLSVYAWLIVHFLNSGPWLKGGTLVLVWLIALFHLIRYGRRAFPQQRVVYLTAFTLFMSGQLWVHPPVAVSWVANAATVAMAAEALLPYLDFGAECDAPSNQERPGLAP